MQRLTRTINRLLKQSGICVVYRDEFERVWPGESKSRRDEMQRFAKEHGWKLRSYDERNFAVFGKERSRWSLVNESSSTKKALRRFAAKRAEPHFYRHSGKRSDNAALIGRARQVLAWTFKLLDDRRALCHEMRRYVRAQRQRTTTWPNE
jgi:hypothetical protein